LSLGITLGLDVGTDSVGQTTLLLVYLGKLRDDRLIDVLNPLRFSCSADDIVKLFLDLLEILCRLSRFKGVLEDDCRLSLECLLAAGT